MKEKPGYSEWEALQLSSQDEPWQTGSPRHTSWRLIQHTHIWQPPTDVLETEDAFIVVVEIAGMRGSDFSISFDKQVLSIRGHRADTNERTAYYQMEIDYGDFGSDVRLSTPIDTSQIDASYSDGFLRVTLPKARSKRIPIDE